MVEKPRKIVNAPTRQSEGAGRWIYGINAVARRLDVNAASIFELHVVRRSTGRLAALERLADRRGVRIRFVDEPTLRRLTGTGAHQGVAARTKAFAYADAQSILATGGAVLLLDQMNDPQNFGALVRTAAAAGMAGIVIPRHGAVGVTPAVEKVAAGAVNDVPIAEVGNFAQFLAILRDHSYWSIGLVPTGGADIFRVEIAERVAIVIGGETGIRPLVERTCDFLASIPMAESVESLNAAIAGAIMMYEVVRRRRRNEVAVPSKRCVTDT